MAFDVSIGDVLSVGWKCRFKLKDGTEVIGTILDLFESFAAILPEGFEDVGTWVMYQDVAEWEVLD